MTLLARVCGIAAALMLEASCSLAGAAADPVSDFRTYGPFAVRSDGSGQLSSDTYAISVVTAGKLEVSYLAPRSHCSSLKMHFLVDGVEKVVSADILPGHTTGYVNL